MPSRKAFFEWVAKDNSIQTQYELAISMRADIHAEEILAIADEEVTMVKRSKHGGAQSDADDDGMVEVVFDPTAVARNRLRVDARKWMLSKMVPKKYGDKVTQEHTGAGGGPITSKVTIEYIGVGDANPDSPGV